MVHQTMNSSRTKAPIASSTITPMTVASPFDAAARRPGLRVRLAALLILGALTACSSTRLERPESAAPVRPPSDRSAPAAPPPAPEISRTVMLREHARWVSAQWSELPGWGEDQASAFWPVLMRSCLKPAPGWGPTCAQAGAATPHDDLEAHAWLMRHLQPFRVENLDGRDEGLITGYFEPLLQAMRRPQGAFKVPLYAPPPDLNPQRPYFTRSQIDSDPALRARLRPQEIAFVDDPLDALLLHIQGSGRLQLTEPNGEQRQLRLAFAGHNNLPYQSVGRWLIERGELRPGEASWPQIKDWARRNPQRIAELLAANPRYVFFREEPLPDPNLGPRGGQGVALTPGRSVAVDRASIPYGTPIWMDATEPLSNTPLRRLAMAQDTGSAITGAVRLDYFWGWGPEAEAQAGRMKQPLHLWALWPRTDAEGTP
ncbi:MAG: MltA domain-containing protein [Burkholderiaceae bacterium]|nr:MltA domain-containing protein [Roseateles sp.]MBV8470307.1 MltA domain-containing protein [Burkholderiaceae bacterium]